ncbi:hypothetical protein GGR62_001433 [Xanthomonas campestris]|nr:hypothetical protein [Xanthomonas sp. 3075]
MLRRYLQRLSAAWCVVRGAFCEAGQALAVADQRAALYHL